MLTIQIQDEQLARQLQRMAERERCSIEDLLKAMAAQYRPGETPTPTLSEQSAVVRRLRRSAYARARHYWESVGDA
ncbi:MAG: hypothetical protein SF029_15185, partial [bacterium]|nr:hypothetical protein [bacterium]